MQRVEEALVDLERQPDDQVLLQDIFRAAHTIKGSSATIGHTRMAALTHAMETRLDDVRKGVAPVTAGLIEALLKALDVLKVLRDEVETRVPADVDVDAAAQAVERRAASARRPHATAAPAAKKAGPRRRRPAAPAIASRSRSSRARGAPSAPCKFCWPSASTAASSPAIRRRARSKPKTRRSPARWSCWSAAEKDQDELAHGAEQRARAGLDHGRGSSARSRRSKRTRAEDETPRPSPSRQRRARRRQSRQPAQAAQAAKAPANSSKTIRIDVARLDALLNLVGELVIDRTRLVQLGGSLADQFGDHRVLSDLQQTALHIGRITDELQEQVMKSACCPSRASSAACRASSATSPPSRASRSTSSSKAKTPSSIAR